MVTGGFNLVTILSIDGGGIRGVIPALFLEELERRTGRPASTLFDFIAGASTGGIIASMLAVPGHGGAPRYTAGEIGALYKKLGRAVFHRNFLRRVFTLGGLAGPKYSARPLEQNLKKYLGETRLHEALSRLIIPAYDMRTCAPWFFKSVFALGHSGSPGDPPLTLAARATSAAPTFFPPLDCGGHCFIDGGVFANNPALCAYADARRLFPDEREIVVVSLGTGEHQDCRSCRKLRHWGTVRWAVPLFGVLMNSAGATVDYQMLTLLGRENYYRFQLPLNLEMTDMDNASPENIACLQELAQAEIRRSSARFRELSARLTGHGRR